jgi:mxaD protein
MAMAELRVERALALPADALWALIGDFGGLHRWHPYVRHLDLSWEGRIRTLHFHDGSRAVERLEARNEQARRYVYTLVDGALPLADCRAVLEVRARAGQGSLVVWSAEFIPRGADAAERLGDMYNAGLDTLGVAL